jgi:deferrochelatase/peroxidase EfeB
LAAAAVNNNRRMLRRGYSYNNGANFYVERWPPWRQALEYDAGLLFVAYQKDPREAFIPVFRKMAAMDAMNQFTTHIGSGLFACPPGARPGGFIGEALFDGVTQTSFHAVPAGPAGAAKASTKSY